MFAHAQNDFDTFTAADPHPSCVDCDTRLVQGRCPYCECQVCHGEGTVECCGPDDVYPFTMLCPAECAAAAEIHTATAGEVTR